MSRRSHVVVLAACLVGSATAAIAAGAPVAVSPGSVEAFTAVGSACPTFSWGAVDGATGYELVVYSAPGALAAAAPGGSGPAQEPLIRVSIPGRARSWTPPAGRCLALAGSYAWSVRALLGEAAGDWSEAALFRVEPAAVVADLAAVLERALGRYLQERGLAFEPDGGLAALISEELAGAAPAAVAEPPAPGERLFYSGGKRHVGHGPTAVTRGVFDDEVELWLEESGSMASDKVQLVFATPEFDGDPADAWAIIVEAKDSASADDGKMFFSTPSFFDALQLFTDGSAILGEQREMKLRLQSSPPIACTSFLQEGMFYWDQDIRSLCVCDGSSWEPIDSDTMGSCS